MCGNGFIVNWMPRSMCKRSIPSNMVFPGIFFFFLMAMLMHHVRKLPWVVCSWQPAHGMDKRRSWRSGRQHIRMNYEERSQHPNVGSQTEFKKKTD